jgi:hypothetical protein
LPNGCAGQLDGANVCRCAPGAVQLTNCGFECSSPPSSGKLACDTSCNPVGCASTTMPPCTACGSSGLNVCIPRPDLPPRIVCKKVGQLDVCWPSQTQLVCLKPTIPAETCNGVDDNCDGRLDENACSAHTGCACTPKTCSAIGASGTFPDGCGGVVTC